MIRQFLLVVLLWFSFGAKGRTVEVAGEIILKGEQGGVTVLRRSDLRALGSVYLGGSPRGIQLRESIAYVACEGVGLRIVNVENSSAPSVVASYAIAGGAVDVVVSGRRCYLAERNGGISVVDVSNPASPILIWRYESSGENLGMSVIGSFAYLAKGTAGVEIVNVSGTVAGEFVRRIETSGGAMGLVVSGGFAYVACGTGGFRIFDVRDVANPQPLGAVSLPGTCSEVTLLDQTAVVTAGDGGLHLIDVTAPTNPILKKTISGTSVSAGGAVAPANPRGEKIIFDCDPGNDVDDVGDLAVMHQLANDGETEILGVMYSMRPAFGAPVIEVVNRTYGRPELPIGVSKTSWWDAWDRYGSHLWTNFFHSIGESAFAPDATLWYRKTLAGAEDKSITVVLAGQLRNMADLWRTPADAFSALSGKELMIQKIKRLVVVAGIFPNGLEFNMDVDRVAAQVANEWNGTGLPVSFMGIENGNDVQIGGTVLTKPLNDPVRAGYNEFYKAWFVNMRPAWAGLGLLFATRGYVHDGTPLFRAIKGEVKVFPDGRNEWTDKAESNVEYLRNEQSNQYYAGILDALLMRAPFERAEPRAYVAEGNGKLAVWNIKDASVPVRLGEYEPARLEWVVEGGMARVQWSSKFQDYALWTARAAGGPWEQVVNGIEAGGAGWSYAVTGNGENYFQLRR